MKHFLSQHKQIEDRLQTLRSVLTFCFGIGYIANVFLAQPLLALINTIMLVLAVILSFIATKGSTRMIHHGSAHQLAGALRRLQRIA